MTFFLAESKTKGRKIVRGNNFKNDLFVWGHKCDLKLN